MALTCPVYKHPFRFRSHLDLGLSGVGMIVWGPTDILGRIEKSWSRSLLILLLCWFGSIRHKASSNLNHSFGWLWCSWSTSSNRRRERRSCNTSPDQRSLCNQYARHSGSYLLGQDSTNPSLFHFYSSEQVLLNQRRWRSFRSNQPDNPLHQT